MSFDDTEQCNSHMVRYIKPMVFKHIQVKTNLMTTLTHEDLKRVRREMLAGIDPEICKLCTDEERNGIVSRRTGTKATLSHPA